MSAKIKEFKFWSQKPRLLRGTQYVTIAHLVPLTALPIKGVGELVRLVSTKNHSSLFLRAIANNDYMCY